MPASAVSAGLMFGAWVPLQKAAGTTLTFLSALAVVLSLVIINSTLALFVAGHAVRIGQSSAFPNSRLIAALVGDIERLEILCVPLVVLAGLVWWWRNVSLRRNRFTGSRWHLPRALEWVLVVWVWCALAGTVLTGALVLADLVRYRHATGGTRELEIRTRCRHRLPCQLHPPAL